jgi:hypothetical protein
MVVSNYEIEIFFILILVTKLLLSNLYVPKLELWNEMKKSFFKFAQSIYINDTDLGKKSQNIL